MSTVANVLRTEPSTALAGAVICISGTLSLGKQDMTTLLQTHGANVASSVTAKVTHVLTSAADAAKKTSKIASAEAKDIPVIGESFVVASIDSGSLADASEHHPANSSGFGCKRGRESTHSHSPPSQSCSARARSPPPMKLQLRTASCGC